MIKKTKKKIFKVFYFSKMFLLVLKRDGLGIALERARETLLAKFIAKSGFYDKYENDLYFAKNNDLAKIVLKPKSENSLKQRLRKVDVIVCVHNALEDVMCCLNSVMLHKINDMQLIIVDDGSQDDTKRYLQEFCDNKENVILHRNEQAQGYTFAANIGLRKSTGDYVVLLNSDTIVTENWIPKMIACAESDEKIGLVGPLSNTASWQSVPFVDMDGDWAQNEIPEGITLQQWATLIEKESDKIYPRIPFLNGFCMMLKRSTINKLGYFDEEVFGRGYGEENDYCIRARKAGISLAIADDTYIFHAQSKSYSNEKRKALCEIADRNLAQKHGRRMIQEGVLYCQNNKILEGIRACIKQLGSRFEIINEGTKRFENKKIVFILPVTNAGGGGNIIVEEAKAMQQMGIDVSLLNLSKNKEAFQKSYPDLELEVIWVNDESEIPNACMNFNAVIASANFTVEWIKPLENKGIILGYYSQDYEPLFYKPETNGHKSAKQSYELIQRLKIFTKTKWNKDQIETNHAVKVSEVGPSYCASLFKPRARKVKIKNGTLRITAMIRPSSPRRNAKLTMKILKDIKLKLKDKVDIVIFGLTEVELKISNLEKKFDFTNLGLLNSKQVSRLFNESDVFVDFSEFQAMGLTAMEAMASGLAVILPRKGGSDAYAKNKVNSLVVDTSDCEECYNSLLTLISNDDLRQKISAQAIEDLPSYHTEFAAAKIAKFLFE